MVSENIGNLYFYIKMLLDLLKKMTKTQQITRTLNLKWKY